MKMFFGALALALAVPAAAQTAPAGAHDAHAQHQGMDHGKPSQGKHPQGEHDCKDCCDKMKQSGGKMDCMEKKGEAKSAAPAPGDHQAHEGHAH